MLRPTFIAAPRLEGIQEEDDHSGSHGSKTSKFSFGLTYEFLNNFAGRLE